MSMCTYRKMSISILTRRCTVVALAVVLLSAVTSTNSNVCVCAFRIRGQRASSPVEFDDDGSDINSRANPASQGRGRTGTGSAEERLDMDSPLGRSTSPAAL